MGFEPGTFAYEANVLTIALSDLISIEYLKVDRVLHDVLLKFICTTW